MGFCKWPFGLVLVWLDPVAVQQKPQIFGQDCIRRSSNSVLCVAVLALPPDVGDIVRGGHVPLGVEAGWTQYGVELLATLQNLGDSVGLCTLRLRGGLRPCLDGPVG